MDRHAIMPELSRRRLLVGLAAASAGATLAWGAAFATSTLPPAPLAPVSENPELVRLGDAFPALVAEFFDAAEKRQAIIKKWWSRWPLAPDVLTYEDACNNANRWERSFTGDAIMPDGSTYRRKEGSEWWERGPTPRAVRTAAELGAAVDNLRSAMRRKRKYPFAPFNAFYLYEPHIRTIDEHELALAELTEMHVAAVAYEADKERVLAASGWTAAKARDEAADKALSEAIAAIMAIRATTLEGVVIKAQALDAFGRLPMWSRITMAVHGDWIAALGSEIVGIAGAANA